jgi:hypothetical protein
VTPSPTIFRNFQDTIPATQSLLIVAIIGALVTPEPGIFVPWHASRPSVERAGQLPVVCRLN